MYLLYHMTTFVFVNIRQGKANVCICHISDTEAIQCALPKTNKAVNEKYTVPVKSLDTLQLSGKVCPNFSLALYI